MKFTGWGGRSFPTTPAPPMAETAKKRRSTTPSAAETNDADVFELPQAGGDAEVVHLPDPVGAVDDAWATEPDEPGNDVARILRHARESRGVSLAEAAGETCITSSYLAALENDEPVSAFPAPAYARFFVREYAQYLGLDGDEMVDRYVEHHGIVDEAQLTEPAAASARSAVANVKAEAIRPPRLHDTAQATEPAQKTTSPASVRRAGSSRRSARTSASASAATARL